MCFTTVLCVSVMPHKHAGCRIREKRMLPYIVKVSRSCFFLDVDLLHKVPTYKTRLC